MTLRIQCDRCKDYSDEAITPYGMPAIDCHPLTNVAVNQPATYRLPDGWTSVYGSHLCHRCTQQVQDYVARQPARAL